MSQGRDVLSQGRDIKVTKIGGGRDVLSQGRDVLSQGRDRKVKEKKLFVFFGRFWNCPFRTGCVLDAGTCIQYASSTNLGSPWVPINQHSYKFIINQT